MTAATFEADALDALARSDEGADLLPGDDALTAAYERLCQRAGDEYADRVARLALVEWLAGRCGGCEPGGTGLACDDHWDGDEEVTA